MYTVQPSPSASGACDENTLAVAVQNAANATRHPELGGHVIAEETRDFWRCGQQGQNCPSTQRYHFGHNAETYFLIGQTMAEGMLKMMKS